MSEQAAYWDNIVNRREFGNEICDLPVEDCLRVILPTIHDSITPRGVDLPVVLDLGCGYGRLTFPITQREACWVIGVDVSPRMIECANYIKQSTDPVNFFLGDGRILPTTPTLDAAFSIAMFQHVDDVTMRGYILQVADRLRPTALFKFQFVEGPTEQHGPLTYDRPLEAVAQWCKDAGLVLINYERDLLHKRWTWLTVGKKP